MLQFETPPAQMRKRSLSYNDLKKRRLLRSERSKSGLRYITKPEVTTTSKKHSLHDSADGNQSKLVNRALFSDHPISKKENLTTREMKNEKLVFYEFIDHAGTSKQLIRNLIQNSKSNRKLVKFSQIRDRLKREKERSRSIQNESGQKTQLKNKLNRFRVAKFQPIKQVVLHRNGELDGALTDVSEIRHEQKSKFLGQSSNEMLRMLEKSEEQECIPIRVLDLLENSSEWKREAHSRERKNKMQRFKRIFPKGFFES